MQKYVKYEKFSRKTCIYENIFVPLRLNSIKPEYVS